jgi:hypothetical protein
MRAVRLLAAALLLCPLAAGCGDDGVEPKTWVKSVCTTLAPWRAAIDDLTSKTNQQLQAATTPAQAKTNIVELLTGAEAASERARAGVQGAGVPAVDGGKGVAEQFTASLTKARDAYGNAKRTIAGLPTDDDKAFYGRVRDAFAVLKSDYERSAIDPAHVGPPGLQEAFEEVPECR